MIASISAEFSEILRVNHSESRSPSLFATGALSRTSPSRVATHAQWDDFPTSSPMTASGILVGATVVSSNR